MAALVLQQIASDIMVCLATDPWNQTEFLWNNIDDDVMHG